MYLTRKIRQPNLGWRISQNKEGRLEDDLASKLDDPTRAGGCDPAVRRVVGIVVHGSADSRTGCGIESVLSVVEHVERFSTGLEGNSSVDRKSLPIPISQLLIPGPRRMSRPVLPNWPARGCTKQAVLKYSLMLLWNPPLGSQPATRFAR